MVASIHPHTARGALLLGLGLLGACSSTTTEPGTGDPQKPNVTKCASDNECTGKTATPLCDVPAGACVALPPGNEIGYRDGTAGSVAFTEIYKADAAAKLTDLAFDPQSGNLWVIGYGDNSTHVGSGVMEGGGQWKRAVDPAAKHFMHKPPAFAMTDAGFWGICGDNDNSQNGPANLFMGPATFSMDPNIFAKRTAGGLGSHLDMLHASPNCKGIAHVSGAKFWVFNGYDNSLDLYDFGKPHPPGGDDHSDGTIFRYAEGQIKPAADGTSSHLFFDAEDSFLYVADTGASRIARLDTKSGKKGGDLERSNEPLVDEAVMDGTKLEVVVAPGTLEKPSGLEIKGGLLYVTDAATSQFHVFDKQGTLLRSLSTDLPAGSLSGFTFGPDNKIWFTDRVGGRVLRIDPK